MFISAATKPKSNFQSIDEICIEVDSLVAQGLTLAEAIEVAGIQPNRYFPAKRSPIFVPTPEMIAEGTRLAREKRPMMMGGGEMSSSYEHVRLLDG
ncbi:MAG: hypothetical protein AAFV88_13940, partial [Planctomycetota bacterium]